MELRNISLGFVALDDLFAVVLVITFYLPSIRTWKGVFNGVLLS